MKKIGLLLSLLLLTSCVEKVRGTFEAKKEVTLRGKDGTVVVPNGVHSAVLKIRQKKSATIVLETNGRKEKVQFNLPKGVRLPTNQGQLRLTSLEVGQPFDVTASANTTISNSGPRTSTESCSRSVVRPVCRWVVVSPAPVCYVDRYGRRICQTPPARSRQVCTNEYTTIYGYRQVTYEYRGETTEYNFTLVAPGTAEEVGNFKGYDYDSDRIVTGYGPCMIYGTGVLIQ